MYRRCEANRRSSATLIRSKLKNVSQFLIQVKELNVLSVLVFWVVTLCVLVDTLAGTNRAFLPRRFLVG